MIGLHSTALRLLMLPLAAAAALTPLGTSRALAYTPKSPEVMEMVEKAVVYLSSAEHGKLGGDCLIALALLKSGTDKSQPEVQRVVKRCQEVCQKDISHRVVDNYELGLAIIFLCEFGPSKYRSELDQMLLELQDRQKPHGGWGYPSPRNEGDTSQTQYAVLCLWSADAIGVGVASESMAQVMAWLIRTQDVSGGWGYQGKDPGAGNTRMPQTGVTKSLSAAGLGSVYVGADMLGLTKRKPKEEDSDLPPALRPVDSSDARRPAAAGRAISASMRRAMGAGNQWFSDNYEIDQQPWGHYYRYALERYESFRELAEGRDDPEPSWYNDGVEFLQETQRPNGTWPPGRGLDNTTATAFAVLFLTRSTKQSIDKNLKGEGTLRGGRGLPRDASNVRMVDGRVVGPTIARSMKELLAILEESDNPELNALLEFPDQAVVDQDQFIDEDVARLRRLVSGQSYTARMVAVRMLVRSRDIDIVPVLIYALSDPDWRVVREARDGLRFISRKFNGFGLPDKSTEPENLAAQRAWKNWYLSVRPDAQFLD